jgi:putative cardiolipin synthase
VAALAFVAACGSLPPQPERQPSHALPPSPESPLVTVARDSTSTPSLTGFRLMPEAYYSLDVRIQLVRRARYSLDVQYYQVENDRSGRLLMRSLRGAALRGVRVRLLVDDSTTVGGDPMFQGLAAFPNVEVRLFNPFCCARESLASRYAASLGDFQRLNHRMHNKLFIADGAIAVMGGRNIADEYFARSAARNFVDMDVLVIGSVVPQLAAIFDMYWNSHQAYAVNAILGDTADGEEARRSFNHLVDDGDQMMAVTMRPVDMLGRKPIGPELDSGRLELVWGSANAFADQPAKVMAASIEEARSMSVRMNVMDRVAESTREVVISSPYFVPGTEGVQAFADLRERGVQVAVLTNSLAATDVPAVHVGYSRYRAALLRTGVKLYELRPSGVESIERALLPRASLGRLHAKAAVIDETMVFIGSMNLDPRSESTNTELGLFARCPELAREVARVIDASRMGSSYEVEFAPGGENLQWVLMGSKPEVVLPAEPEVTPFMEFRNMLFAPFVPEQLL